MRGSIDRRDAENESVFGELIKSNPRVHSLGVFASLRFVLFVVLLASSCSIPNLELPECDRARDLTREFYSLHFGNDMTFSMENLEKRRVYLTPDFYEALKKTPPAVDPFTRTHDVPKAFRVGECAVKEPGKRVVLDVLLFWKTDTRTEQRTIQVALENVDDRWLVDTVD